VLVRILIDDPGQAGQVEAARALASRAGKVYVSLVVQVETVWVLESTYRLEKAAIIDILTHLHTNSAFVLQDETITRDALTRYCAGNVDFADGVILAQAQRQGLELFTFDKRLARQTGACSVCWQQAFPLVRCASPILGVKKW